MSLRVDDEHEHKKKKGTHKKGKRNYPLTQSRASSAIPDKSQRKKDR